MHRLLANGVILVTKTFPQQCRKAASREKRSLEDRIRHSVDMDVRNLHDLHANLDEVRAHEKEAKRLLAEAGKRKARA